MLLSKQFRKGLLESTLDLNYFLKSLLNFKHRVKNTVKLMVKVFSVLSLRSFQKDIQFRSGDSQIIKRLLDKSDQMQKQRNLQSKRIFGHSLFILK